MSLLDPWTIITKLTTHLIRLRSVRTTAQSETERIQEVTRRSALPALYAANLCQASRAFNFTSSLTPERNPDLWKIIRIEQPYIQPQVDTYCLQDLWGIIRAQQQFIQPLPLVPLPLSSHYFLLTGFVGKHLLAGASTLAGHKSIDTGQKPFGCSICGQGFRSKSGLAVTKRSTQKGISPFVLCVISLSDSWKTSKSI
ncbi:unnamed protein product [Cyprideis torosa]|uniref:Uncharacterized protein n=1 Tax=Cyprideis torosa TaxID=163714 RepID=A0A7R8WNC2_9CRUS|nr:unnamed protein product [Cyprideis torosa]CAG0899407.1 unnamed protein product [Cyprideis torosa]